MLKREWQKIAKNKWMLLILIAIITIPAIYTSVFLGSMWDPYGDADELPVAVINKDRKVDYNGTTLAVGDELVKNLKKTKALDFRFVSEKKAEDGLKSGKYYMIISIPEDFSENATTLMDENPRKMKLTYKTNPGTNYVASKMDDSAMAKIEKSVSEKVTETYAKTVFAQVKVAGKGFSKAADGAGKIEKGAKKLKKGNNTIEKNLRKLASSSLTFQNGAKTLSVGLRTYTNGVAQVDSGATSLQSGTKTLKNGTGSAKSGANSLASGAKTLQNGTGQLKNGAGQLSTGAKKLQSGSKSLKNGVSEYTAGVGQLASNNKVLKDGVSKLSTGSKQLSSGTQTLTTGIGGVLTAAQQTSDQIGNSLPAESDIQKLTSGMEELNAGIQKLNKALGNQETQAAVQTTKTTTTTAENEQSKQAAESASSAKQSVRVMQQKVSNLKNSSALKNLSEEEKEQLLSEIGEVENAASNVESNVDETYTKSQKAVQSKVTTTTTTKQAKSGLTDTIQKMLELKQSVAKIAAASNQVLPTGEKAINSLYGGLKEVKTGLDKKGTTQSDMGMIQALTALKSGATEVQTGMASMESGINDGKNGLSIGIAKYTAGVDKLNKNSKALNSGASQLNSGINQVSVKLPEFMTGINKLYAGSGTLASGANQLASGIGKLDSGAGQLYDGTKTLKAGTGKLVANNSTLNNGVTQLASGAGQISNGSTKLANGSTTLGNGLGTLTDGSKTLKDSLQKGADQVNDIKTTNKTNKMFAAPVKTNNVEYSHVQNNGHAMAPYMMSVGLFVACMAFTLMYPLMERNEEVKTGLQWWLSKVTVMAAISIAQAVIMVGVLMVVNGLEPNYVGKTFGMAILASMAFMSLIAFFEMMINRVGSYVLLVFMVIQLGAAGGTYPLNMAPHFYTVLHKYMPFSYTVHAFRHTLSMDGKIGGDVAVFVGILVVSTLATILLYRFRMKKQVGGTLEVDGPAVQH